MNNEKLEVLEMEKTSNGNEMADDFFDQDLVNLDFDGLDVEQKKESEPSYVNKYITNEPVNETSNTDLYGTNSITSNDLNDSDDQSISIDNDIDDDADNDAEISLPNPEIDKKNKLDNSYVLSNFDVLFDSLYSDVVGANNFITDLMEKKSSLNKDEQLLEDFKEKFEKEKEDFKNFVEVQKKAIESEKSQAASFIESKRARLHSEENKFNEDMVAKKNEISLLEQALKLERDRFETEKANFFEKKGIELKQIDSAREKLNRDISQFEADKKLSEEEINSIKKDLQMQQEQFAKYKELEQKKIDLEEKNLSQSCARFKELVSQFNSGFEQLPNKDDNK